MADIERAIQVLVIERQPRYYAESHLTGTVGNAYNIAIQALTEKQQREENKALTVEYLKEINQDMENRRWVWIEVLKPYDYKTKVSAYYQAQSDYTKGEAFCCGYPGMGYSFDYSDYGKIWLAYRNEVVSVAEESEGENG